MSDFEAEVSKSRENLHHISTTYLLLTPEKDLNYCILVPDSSTRHDRSLPTQQQLTPIEKYLDPFTFITQQRERDAQIETPQPDGILVLGTWTECQRSMMVSLLTFPWDGATWQ